MVRVTALGSLPGTDVGAGVRVALEATPDLAWLPEFPHRGPWAALPGRATAFLSGLGAELAAGEWKLASVPGVDQRRARAALADDLSHLEEAGDGFTGRLKVAVPGPWTTAASLFLPLGGRVLGDRGARADVAASLVEGVKEVVTAIERRLPGVEVVVQVDEPSLPAVLAGRVPTEGGFFRHRSVTPQEVAEALAQVAGLAPATVLHCCAPGVDIALVTGSGRHGAGFGGVSLDVTLLGSGDLDAVSAAVEAGREVYLGVLGATEQTSVDVAVRRTLTALGRLQLGPALADRLWLTPTCGLAATPVSGVTPLLDALRRAAPLVDEALRN